MLTLTNIVPLDEISKKTKLEKLQLKEILSNDSYVLIDYMIKQEYGVLASLEKTLKILESDKREDLKIINENDFQIRFKQLRNILFHQKEEPVKPSRMKQIMIDVSKNSFAKAEERIDVLKIKIAQQENQIKYLQDFKKSIPLLEKEVSDLS
jgi:hypothetical protein